MEARHAAEDSAVFNFASDLGLNLRVRHDVYDGFVAHLAAVVRAVASVSRSRDVCAGVVVQKSSSLPHNMRASREVNGTASRADAGVRELALRVYGAHAKSDGGSPRILMRSRRVASLKGGVPHHAAR